MDVILTAGDGTISEADFQVYKGVGSATQTEKRNTASLCTCVAMDRLNLSIR